MSKDKPTHTGFEAVAIHATRYQQALIVLRRHGITLAEIDGAFPSSNYGRKILTFPEVLDKELREKFYNYEDEIRELKQTIYELEKQIPKRKEIELLDGSTMQIIDEEHGV